MSVGFCQPWTAMTVPTRRIKDASGCETLDGRDTSRDGSPDRNEEAASGVAPREIDRRSTMRNRR
jgi:hypothetical protein